MRESSPDSLLVRAARRARVRPQFMAWIFARYEDLEGYDASDLRKTLRVSTADWPKLALCLRPRHDNFAADIRAIASRFRCDASVLANVVRLSEAGNVMQRGEAEGNRPGLLIAARKRPKHKDHEADTNQ
jgi:hypothetical protein